MQKLQLRGAEVFACQLAAELSNMGVHVDIAYLFSGGQGLREQFPHLDFIDLEAGQRSRLPHLAALKRLSDLIVRNKYDLVQANAGDTLKYGVLSKLIHRWDALLIFRNANKMSAFIRSGLHRILNQWLLSKCDYCISVSEACRQDLIQLYPGAIRNSTTVPIGTYLFEDVVPAGQDRLATGPVFVNIASFVAEKNHDFLLDVFFKYYQKNLRGNLWLIGDGKLRGVLEAKVRSMGLESRVTFWGIRKDAISLLKSADVMIMPSLIEGMPGVILESLSCGIPVIASTAGGIPEVIDNGYNGYLVPVPDADAYVSSMETLTTNESVREKFISEGRRLIEIEYLMPRIGERFLKVYQKLFESSKKQNI